MLSGFRFMEAAFHAGLAPHARAFLSTDCHHEARGQSFKIPGGVLITPSLTSTIVASVSPLRQPQFGLERITARAGLARREKAIGNCDRRAVEARFILQLSSELEERRAHDQPRQAPVARHALHIRILNAAPAISLAQMCCQLMQRILADTTDSGMKTREAAACQLAIS